MNLTQLAMACGSVGGVEITESDVRQELRSRSYSKLVGRDGLLPPMEMNRLRRNVRSRVAQRLVDEEFERQTKLDRSKLHDAQKQVASHRPHATMQSWKRANSYGVAMASGQPSLSPKARLAWEEYLRGPMWLR
jgi:hypothetical protein